MQRFRYVTLPGMRYVILVVLLLSFISTFNQFGLIFLMTGGGGRAAPRASTRSSPTKRRSVRCNTARAAPSALSVAPLMAFLIYLLSKYMRHDERAAGVSKKALRHRQVLRRHLQPGARCAVLAGSTC